MYHIKDSTKLCEFTIKEETYRKHRQNDEQQRFEAKHRGNVKLNVSSRETIKIIEIRKIGNNNRKQKKSKKQYEEEGSEGNGDGDKPQRNSREAL